MKLNIHIFVSLLIACAAFGQGSLTPPGAPAPMMKTLSQIEPRIAITNSGALTISRPGSYYLTTNITVSSGSAINIATNGVALDLNGFTLFSTEASPSGYGVSINNGLRDITIVNGFIEGGVTNGGSSYSGPGFVGGIGYLGNGVANTRVYGVSVSGCSFYGILLNTGDSTVVDSCTVKTVGHRGISASVVKNSIAMDCGVDGIYGDQITDCRGQSTGSGQGVYGSTAVFNSYGASVTGIGISGGSVHNSFGLSTNNYGIAATMVMNSFGQTTSGTAAINGFNSSYSVANRPGGTGFVGYVANGCANFVNGMTNNVSWKYNMP